MEEKRKSIGGAWVRQTKGGEEFFSLQIEINGEKLNFSMYPNGFKKADAQPDWVIYPYISKNPGQAKPYTPKPTYQRSYGRGPTAQASSIPPSNPPTPAKDIPQVTTPVNQQSKKPPF